MTTNYTHTEIREFAVNEANGTIVEQALLACKNLESAICKRKSITTVEKTACEMLVQCALELAEHLNDKPIDDSRSMLPRELRNGLKREIVLAMVGSRYSYNHAYDSVYDSKTDTDWWFNAADRLYRKW